MNWKLLRAHMEREGRRDACTYDRLRLSCEQSPDCLLQLLLHHLYTPP